MITFEEAKKIFEIPFFELIYQAHGIHKDNFDSSYIQLSSLFNLQTGGCSEDCSYCAQSCRNKTKMPKQTITSLDSVINAAKKVIEIGGTRLCMGASGRAPNKEFFDLVCKAIIEVKKLGLEACVTMGFLTEDQVKTLKDCGLDYYNHNVDTSPEHYGKIITSRTIDDRIKTIKLIQKYGINVCSGGIIGVGESNDDRIKMLVLLANLDKHPTSVPINKLIKIPGTPLENAPDVDNFDFIRTIALARILMPKSYVRLSAGRENMSDEMHALCFFAGANSIFIGEKLLTAPNSDYTKDMQLLNRLNLKI